MLSHFLFYIGHFVSRVANRWPWQFLHPYPLYNWLLIKSAENDPQGKLWKYGEKK